MPEHAPVRDRDLRRLAHALVAEAPPAPARLPVGPRPLSAADRERRWLRRYIPAVAAATVVLISLAGALVLDIRHEASTGDDQQAVQRLILESWPGELMPDGSAVPLGIGELFPVSLTGTPQPLPGGRHVVVGEYYPSADPARHRAQHLVVVNADGQVELDRQVGTGSDWVSLLATTPREAILIRAGRDIEDPVGPGLDRPMAGPGRIVAHDYATGQERTLANTTVGGLDDDRADAVGNHVVLVHSFANDDSCPLQVIDLTSGAMSTLGSVRDCSEVRAVRVSPGGEFVAISYAKLRLASEHRLAVVDLADGSVLDDVLLGDYGTCAPDSFDQCLIRRPVNYLGMAWDNDTTVRVALFDLRRYPDGNGYGNPIPSDAIVQYTASVN